MLPKELSNAIEYLLSSRSLNSLKTARHHVTASYHDPEATHHLRSETERLSYLATRMPATYAVVHHVLKELLPFKHDIASLLDLGSGPGTVLWAAKDLFPLASATCIEQDELLLTLGKKLLESLAPSSLPSLTMRVSSLHGDTSFPSHDLVTMNYVLSELDDLARPDLLKKAWRATQQFLILVEPGTPHGYEGLMEARAVLLKEGAFLLAPCLHSNPCPLRGKDWCHFSIRLERPSFHRLVKEASLPFEDEKFSYLVFSRKNVMQEKSRIIKKPLHGSGHITLDLCTRDGIKRKIVSKRFKDDYKASKKLRWGQIFDVTDDV